MGNAWKRGSALLTNDSLQFNPGHRHDEEHEKLCDEKRSNIADQHRFKSFFPERDGNLIKWYVDGRDYFWVRESPHLFAKFRPHGGELTYPTDAGCL